MFRNVKKFHVKDSHQIDFKTMAFNQKLQKCAERCLKLKLLKFRKFAKNVARYA